MSQLGMMASEGFSIPSRKRWNPLTIRLAMGTASGHQNADTKTAYDDELDGFQTLNWRDDRDVKRGEKKDMMI